MPNNDSSTAFRLCSYDRVVRKEIGARTEDTFGTLGIGA
jgi:hypothetical protein